MGLDDPIARATKLLGEQAKEDVFDSRVAPLQSSKVVPKDGSGLPLLERRHRCRPTLAWKQQGEFAEGLTGRKYVEQHAVTEWRDQASGEPAADD